MFNPLNPRLYSSLKRLFGVVKVSHPGLEITSHVGGSTQMIKGQRKRVQADVIDHWGETYSVCCDRCNDTRFRLCINHAFGTLRAQRYVVFDSQGTVERSTNLTRGTRLAYCFNEGCYEDFAARGGLYHRIYGCPVEKQQPIGLQPGKKMTRAEVAIALPGILCPLSQLESSHKALEYIAGRGFDQDKLESRYRVQYCLFDANYLVSRRIIIPVYFQSRLVGWQARLVGDDASKSVPKYFTCPGMQTSQCLYNYDRARRYHTGIVVEGVTDAWAIGSMGLCCFGSHPRPRQCEILSRTYADGSVVLIPDQNSKDKTLIEKVKRSHELLRSKMGRERVAIVTLPEGTDPGSLDTGYLRKLILKQAKSQRVKVSFERVRREAT